MRPLCCLHRWGRKPQKKKKEEEFIWEWMRAADTASTVSHEHRIASSPCWRRSKSAMWCSATTDISNWWERKCRSEEFIYTLRKEGQLSPEVLPPPSMCRCRTVRCEHRWLNLPLEVPSISQIYTLMSSIPQLFSRSSNQLLKLCSIAGAYSTKIS